MRRSDSLLLTLSRLHEDFLLAQPRYQDARSIARHRAIVYSQNGEDGAIAEIFRRLGGPRHDATFIEIGVGDGSENNTRLLLENGWRGIWCEGAAEHCAAIQRGYAAELADGRLQLCTGVLTRENAPLVAPDWTAFDLLSIDIDMNTSHVWRALGRLRPVVAVIEYNPAHGPSLDWEIPYDPAAAWQGDNYFGASLKALERLGAELGYRLVGCELTGINAYFVREDLASEALFLGPFSAEQHYEPLRLLSPVSHRRRSRPSSGAEPLKAAA